MKKIYNRAVLLIFLFSLHFSVFSQLVVNNSMTAAQLVQNVLLGPGISAFNISSSAAGTGVSVGQFSNGNTTNLGITAGVVMSTGSIFNIPNTGGGFASTDNGSGGDVQLDALASATIYDATWLQFDFVPTTPQVTFRYVFGSEEYPEFVNSGYNDVFGFFITGPNPGGGNYTNVNLALIPSTTLPVSIDNVNSGSYSQYYIDNASGATIVFDAFTSVLTATCQVTPCQTYHIKFAVGDAGDAIYDSGVFLEAGSFSGGNSVSTSFTTSNPLLSTDAIEGCTDAIVSFTLATPFSTATTITYTIGGTATNGIDYTMIPTSVTIPAGSTTTTLIIDPVLDALAEGNETVQLIVATPPCGYDTVLINIANYTPLVITAPPDVSVCDGDQLILTSTITGGLGPFNYLWNNGTANATTTVYPTPAGTYPTYIVTVTDACNYQPSDNTVVTVNNCTLCNTYAGLDDKICGLTYNMLQATTQPGDYNTFWTSVSPGVIFSNFQSPTSSVTVPSFGTYNFVWSVTSSSGSTCTDTVKIIFAPTPTSTFTVVNVDCFGENVVVTYTGNAPAGAIYTWNFGGGVSIPGTGQGPHNVLYGSAGNFSIQLSVNDNGCASNATTQSVNNPPLLDLSVVAGSVTCASGTNGSVNANVTGGIPPYNYSWSNGPTPPTVAGSYTATVTDLNGCTDSSSFTIFEPQAIAVTPSLTNLNCFNDQSGVASVSVSGGTLPYTYDWSNDTSIHTTNQSNMQAGLYVVSITDNNGCLVTQSITITQPPAITINTTNVTNVSCFGGNDGNATVNANGGTFPLSYTLTGPLQPNGNFPNLSAGNYIVTVIDDNNCTSTYPIGISEPTQVTLLSQTFTNITCFGQHNGTITASATGGTGTLNYSIGGPSQIVGTFTNLYPGSYLVSVTDNNGCAVTGTPLIISQPPMLSIDSVGSTNLTCFGSNNGTAAVIVSGGTAPLLYMVGSTVQTNGIYLNAPAGTFSVTVTDANGCTIQTNPITITQPPQLIITSQNATAIPCFGNPATISVIATGGTNPLTYSLNGNTPTATGVYTGLTGGAYSVTIRDNNNCTITSNTFTITEPPLLMIIDSTFTNITCYGASTGSATVSATGGTPPYDYSIITGITQNSNIFSDLDIGNYTLTVTDDNGCSDITNFTLTEPTALISTATGTNVNCNGGSDGTLSVTTNGGTPPYSIFWSNGATTTTIINIGVGIYFVSVTDANFCSITDTVIISQPSPPYITSSSDSSICKNQQAIIVANATGGTQPYTFYWNGTQGMSVYIPTLSMNTTVSVFVIDANGCISDTAKTYIGIIPDVILDIFSPDDSVCVGTPVNIYWTATGGDGGPYTVYNEQNGQYDIVNYPYSVTPSNTHTYTFYAKDFTCPISGRDTLSIYTLPIPSVTISADDYKGCQPFTVNFSVETNPVCTGFLWDFGEEDAISYTKFPQHVYSSSGIYDVGVTVTSIDGCIGNLIMQQLITVYPKPESRFDYTPEVVSILKPQIYFTNFSTEGTSYMWSFGDGDSSLAENPDHLYGNIGQYNVLLAVETSYGCKDTSIAKIVVKDEIAFYVPTAFSPDNDGINDVFLIKGHGIDLSTFFLAIYDRWGELVFTSDKLDIGWDGSIKKGKKGTSDTYVWMVSFNDLNGKKYVKSGNVTMIK